MPRSPLLPVLRVGSALAAGVVLLYCPRTRVPVVSPDAEAPTGWVVDVFDGGAQPVAGGKFVPPRPFQEQVRPVNGKCPDPDDVAISDGCWAKMAKTPRAPDGCGERYYQHGESCYLPVTRAKRVPTSITE